MTQVTDADACGQPRTTATATAQGPTTGRRLAAVQVGTSSCTLALHLGRYATRLAHTRLLRYIAAARLSRGTTRSQPQKLHHEARRDGR